MALVQCRPVWHVWSPPLDRINCLNFSAEILAYGVTDLLTDMMILSLPVPMVWRLQMEARRKVAVSALFLLGSL